MCVCLLLIFFFFFFWGGGGVVVVPCIHSSCAIFVEKRLEQMQQTFESVFT